MKFVVILLCPQTDKILKINNWFVKNNQIHLIQEIKIYLLYDVMLL